MSAKRPIRIAAHLHPLVRELLEKISQGSETTDLLLEHTGVSFSSISHWRAGHCPKLNTFEAVASAVGLKLALEESCEKGRILGRVDREENGLATIALFNGATVAVPSRLVTAGPQVEVEPAADWQEITLPQWLVTLLRRIM